MNLSNTHSPITGIRRYAWLAVLFVSAASLRANPIELPERSGTPQIAFLLAFAILLEVVCIWLVLWRSRKPRFFILWLIGMNLLTYPAFVGLLRALDDLRPALAVLIGEAVVVVVEGGMIYLMCRFILPAQSDLTAPSAIKCWLASFVGNVCSAATFPILLAIYDRFVPD